MCTFINTDLLLRVIQKQQCFADCRPLVDQDFQSCIDLATGFVSKIRLDGFCESCNNLIWLLLTDIHKELQSPRRIYRSPTHRGNYAAQEENVLTALNHIKL